MQVVLGGAGDVGAFAGVGPGRAVQAVFQGYPHEFVVGRVEGDFVNPVAVAVVGAEAGFVGVGLVAEFDGVGQAGPGPEAGEVVVGEACAFPQNGFPQRGVLFVEVVVLQRPGLVDDLMGGRQVTVVGGGLGFALRVVHVQLLVPVNPRRQKQTMVSTSSLSLLSLSGSSLVWVGDNGPTRASDIAPTRHVAARRVFCSGMVPSAMPSRMACSNRLA